MPDRSTLDDFHVPVWGWWACAAVWLGGFGVGALSGSAVLGVFASGLGPALAMLLFAGEQEWAPIPADEWRALRSSGDWPVDRFRPRRRRRRRPVDWRRAAGRAAALWGVYVAAGALVVPLLW